MKREAGNPFEGYSVGMLTDILREELDALGIPYSTNPSIEYRYLPLSAEDFAEETYREYQPLEYAPQIWMTVGRVKSDAWKKVEYQTPPIARNQEMILTFESSEMKYNAEDLTKPKLAA